MGYPRARLDDLDELKAALTDRLEDLAVHLLGHPNNPRSHDWRWGEKGGRSLIVRSRGGKRRGLWAAWDGDGKGGSPLDMIAEVLGISLPEAIRWARDFLGFAPGASPPKPSAAKLAEREARSAEQAENAAQADTAKIAFAGDLARAASTINGTIAETYLVQTRHTPRPACGWPDAVRFHAASRSLLVVSTLDDGTVVAVQSIRLTQDGKKAAGTSDRPTKITHGRMAGGMVRLPAFRSYEPGEARPVLVFEGPEKGITGWSCTGHATVITLGVANFKNVSASPGDFLVMARDDDPQESPPDKATRRAVATWREAGANVVVATPWSARRFNKTDFSDVLEAGGPAAVIERIRLAVEAPARMLRQLPARTASEIVETAIVEHFARAWGWERPEDDDDAPPPIVEVVRATVGVSKSTAMRRAVLSFLRRLRRAGRLENVAIAVPSHRLGAEAETLLRVLAGAEFTVRVWRGLGADDPERSGHKMCDNLDAVADAIAVGARVQESCCSYKPKGKERVRCPFFNECGSQRQRAERADIWIVAHELLFGEKPKQLGELAAVVVDEAAWQDGLEGVGVRFEGGIERHSPRMTLSLDALTESDRRPRETEHDPSFTTIAYHRGRALDGLRNAFRQDGPGAISRRALAEISQGAAIEARGLELSRLKKDTGLRPGMSRSERAGLVEAASGNRTILLLARFWSGVAALSAEDGPERSGWIALATVTGPHGPQDVLYLKGRREVADGWRVPTLILDANADLELLHFYWPNAGMIADVEATAPHQHVRQTTDCAFSKSRLAPLDVDEAAATMDAEAAADLRRKATSRTNARRDVRDFACREARATSSGRMLLIAQKAVIEGMVGSGGLGLRPGIETGNHNGVAGIDRWRDVEREVIVGRTMPRTTAVERMAEALTGRAVEPVERYEKQDAWRLVRGRLVACQADAHPHSIAEKIRWQVCEGEVVQNVGRGRGIWREASNPLHVLIATDVPLPFDLDEEISASSLKPTPADRMLGAGGIAFANAAHASAAYPDIWPKPKDAENAFRRARTPSFSYENSIHREMRESSPWSARVRYQVAGAGQKVVEADVDLVVCSDPRAAVEQALAGIGPLARFEVIGPPEPDPPGVTVPTTDVPAEEPVPVVDLEPETGELVVWQPAPAFFTPAPGATELDRAAIELAALLPWRVNTPRGDPGPAGWTRAAMPGGP